MSGLGDRLFYASLYKTESELVAWLPQWRKHLQLELRTNTSNFFDTKQPTLAEKIDSRFPDLDVLRLYTQPVVNADTNDYELSRWLTPIPKLERLVCLSERHFDWGTEDRIIEKFRNTIYEGVILHRIRRSLLFDDGAPMRLSPEDEEPIMDVKAPGTERADATKDGLVFRRILVSPRSLVEQTLRSWAGERDDYPGDEDYHSGDPLYVVPKQKPKSRPLKISLPSPVIKHALNGTLWEEEGAPSQRKRKRGPPLSRKTGISEIATDYILFF
jgi:hypothetical protein